MVELGVEDLIALHLLGIERHGGLGTVTRAARDAMGTVLHSATYHEGLLGQAAAILCYIARAQHFTDGNKRVAWLGCTRLLEINGFYLKVTTDDAITFVHRIVTENLEVPEIADQLSQWLEELPAPTATAAVATPVAPAITTPAPNDGDTTPNDGDEPDASDDDDSTPTT